jgi:hypothetical protein
MKMDRKYVNRRRWVAFIVVGIPLLILAFYVINHIWWTTNGYCWGTPEKCWGM